MNRDAPDSAPKNPLPSFAEPEACDLGVLTVIPIEKDAMLEAFGVRDQKPENCRGCLYWRASVDVDGETPLQVVIGFCEEAGSVSAALRTVRFVRDFDPSLLVLAGIAAGQRENFQLGEVVFAIEVADLVMAQVEDGVMTIRPSITRYSQPVSQLIGSFTCNLETLKQKAASIRNKLTPRFRRPKDPAKVATFQRDVSASPKVKDCVIGSGNLLVRDSNKFPEYQKIHPKITVIEMEAAGMVRALKDVKPTQAWLVVRGISDFADETKDKVVNAQPYAAATAAAYVRLLAEKGFIRVLLGRTNAAAQLNEGISTPITSRAVIGLTTTASTMPSAVAGDLLTQTVKQFREEWANSPSEKIVAKLREVRASNLWQNASADARSQACQFEAEIVLALDGDVTEATRLAQEAEALGGENRALKARIYAEQYGAANALSLLEGPTTLADWNTRIALFLESGDDDSALAQIQSPPEGVGPDAETRRLHALALIGRKRLGEADEELSKAEKMKKGAFALRFARAIQNYFTVLSIGTPEAVFALTPLPVPFGFIKRDTVSLKTLERTETEFKALSELVPPRSRLWQQLQLWRFACAANHIQRQTEAAQLCRELLIQEPSNALVLQWAKERDYVADTTSNIEALAEQLGVTL
jgi:nucleoside phosphorylase